MMSVMLGWFVMSVSAQSTTIDGFDQVDDWELLLADGVKGNLVQEDGVIRLDYDFSAGSGYIVIRKRVEMDVDPNYRYTLRYRGDGPRNTLEFKLIDPSLENVWWSVERDYAFPSNWAIKSIRRRHVSFAWGPEEGEPLQKLGAIEIAVTASQGGVGQVWFDELGYEQLPAEEPKPVEPTMMNHDGHASRIGADGRMHWNGTQGESVRFEFLTSVEFSGMRLRWDEDSSGTIAIQTSSDAKEFTNIARERIASNTEQFLFLPETEAQHIRIQIIKGGGTLESIEFMPVDRYPDSNAYFQDLAYRAPAGAYPMYFRELTPWTVIGLPEHDDEALVSVTGRIEPRKEGYSLEPFLVIDGKVHTWADAQLDQSLLDDALPIPSVLWDIDGLEMNITAVASDVTGSDALYVRYQIVNTNEHDVEADLVLAARPFQVLPAAQFLNTIGGAVAGSGARANLNSINVDKRTFLQAKDGADAVRTHAGSHGSFTASIEDQSGWSTHESSEAGQFPSAALRYEINLQSGEDRIVDVVLPMGADDSGAMGVGFSDVLVHEKKRWEGLLDRFDLLVPESATHLRDTIRANLAYILINADGPGIRPGSRSYERSWIRDGAMTSAALIALGNHEEARAFIDWYSTYQYEDGKIPCVVDARGADPVDENDAPGEYLFAIRNSAEAGGKFDEAFAREMYPSVLRTVAFIDRMRSSRLTPEYTESTDPILRACAGLMPESISHEGYSAKPMHSYWDDFWVYRGLRDAEQIAIKLGEDQDAASIRTLREEFGRAISNSIALATATHNIDYVPGCVELGDFDGTSTAIAFYPTGAAELIDDALLESTFERVWGSTQDRIEGRDLWDGMTPYEVRTVGTFVRLGWVDRANEYMDWLMTLQAPSGWRQWGEIAYREDAPCRFVGDMPHTWVGSGAILSILSMFVYEEGAQLILAAGIPSDWMIEDQPIGVRGIVTRFGTLSYTMHRRGDSVRLRIDPGCTPPGGFAIHVSHLIDTAESTVQVDDMSVPVSPDGYIYLAPHQREILIRW